MLRVHCAVPEIRSGNSSFCSSKDCNPRHLHSVSVITAKGKHPAPFRTRKLSLSAPMVLHGGPCGRLGRRRTTHFRAGHTTSPEVFSAPCLRHIGADWTPGLEPSGDPVPCALEAVG